MLMIPPVSEHMELPRPVSEDEFLAVRDARFMKEDLELPEGVHILPMNSAVISHVLDKGCTPPEGDKYGTPRPFWVPETYKNLIRTVFDEAVAPDDPILLELSTEICAQYENMDFSIITEDEYSYFANVFGKTAPILLAKKLLLWEEKQPVPLLRMYLSTLCHACFGAI